MRAGTLASPAAATASVGAFATYVIASTLILAYVILGVFLRPPAALHATPPVLIVTPASLDFGRVEVGRKVVLTEMIKTNGSSQLQWKAVSGNVQWLNITPSRESKEPDNFREVIYNIKANTSNLHEGKYSVIFAISTDGENNQKLLVQIQVIPHPSPAMLNVNPLLVDFGNVGSQGVQFLTISNSGQMDLNWVADKGYIPWLTLDTSKGIIVSGGIPWIIEMTVDSTQLAEGLHTAVIKFTSNGGNALVGIKLVVVSKPSKQGPTVSSINPSSGPAAGGTSTTITGANFTNVTSVSFGSTAVISFSIISNTQITAISPPGSGTVDVNIMTPSGSSATSAADQFTYTPLPIVTGIFPKCGTSAGGDSITIAGSGFTSATGVSFGLISATSFAIKGDTQITAVSPPGSGTVDVTVTTPMGSSLSSAADQFTYPAPPTVTGISPASGQNAGGTSVTITGTNFTCATGVTFGTPASFTIISDTQITAISPGTSNSSDYSSSVDVTVTTTAGTSAISNADQFTYLALPFVFRINPGEGPVGGGSSVIIEGINFNDVTAVSFGSTAASSFTVKSDRQIIAVSPVGSGTVGVTVTTHGGTSYAYSADQFTFINPPSVSIVSPASGSNTGGTAVVITGKGFTNASIVSFGRVSVAASGFTVNSDTQITAFSPPGSGTVDVTVTTPGGTSATSPVDQFSYY